MNREEAEEIIKKLLNDYRSGKYENGNPYLDDFLGAISDAMHKMPKEFRDLQNQLKGLYKLTWNEMK